MDIVGLEDNTHIEIWDIYANVKNASETINRLEKKNFYIATESFFKLVASRRVAALLCGGSQIFETMSEMGWEEQAHSTQRLLEALGLKNLYYQ